MPSTFTENTGIELIADGEQAGAWGQTTNDNFDIIDRALNGSVSIALSGTTHTLTTASGVLSDGQAAVLVFTGSPSGTNTVTIAPNTAQKTYFVTNSTAQTVVLSQGSGANVSVPAGTSKIVFSNGAGAGAAVFDITNSLSGTFTGNVTGDLTGNVTGDLTGNVTGDLTGNVTITGGTIDGTVIGGSTPAAISGTTGSFSGNLTVDTNTLFVDAASNNVGIGTSSAARGPLHINAASGVTELHMTNAATGTGSSDGLTLFVSDLPVSDAGGAGLFYREAGPLRFGTFNTERLRIDASGNVGIGTSSPGSLLTVNGTADVSFRRNNQGSGTTASITKINATSVTSSNGQFNLTAADLELAAGAVQSSNINFSGGTWTAGSVSILSGRTSLQGGFPNATRNEGVIRFGTRLVDNSGVFTDTERARIDASGNLLINSTSTAQGSSREFLFINGAGRATELAVFRHGSTNLRNHIHFRNPNGVVGVIGTTGSSTFYNTSSDYRLKENVVPLADAADRLAQIPVYRFNFIADPDTSVDGFLAHEVQAFVPECVTGQKDEVDAEGNPVYQGIDQSKLVPLLTAALQDALKRIEALEAQLNP